MKPKITTLMIEHFRALRELKIEGLGHVNLITGRNNTGKSSLLEALRILASEGSVFVIDDILSSREENAGGSAGSTRPINSEGILLVTSLFRGFPKLLDKPEPIVISAPNRVHPRKVMLKMVWVREERDKEGTRRLLYEEPDSPNEHGGIPGVAVEIDGVKRLLNLDANRRSLWGSHDFPDDTGEDSHLPCVFVSPYGGEHTATLGSLWDRVALSDREKDVVDALRIIDPEISAVSMVGGEGRRQQRTAKVRTTSLSRPVPLRSFGDGLNRLFGIILSLVNAKDGLLLVDEFENGMHHTVQLDAWRIMFRLAHKLNIQVFATSHSWDAIEAFQMAAAETPDDGVLVRLARKGEEIIPTLFREEELAIATRDSIEVR